MQSENMRLLGENKVTEHLAPFLDKNNYANVIQKSAKLTSS